MKTLFRISIASLFIYFAGCSKEPADQTSPSKEGAPATASETNQTTSKEDDLSELNLKVEKNRPTAPAIPPPSPLPQLAPIGEVLFQSGFESDPVGPEAKLNFHTHPGFRAEQVDLGTGETALIIAGSDEPKHSWRPALEFRFGSQSEGRLKISFDVYQASFDAASLNLQVSDMSGGYIVHQSMKITNDFLLGSGSTERLFKDKITAGIDAKWHRVEWIVPLPGKEDSEMALRFDGETVREMRHKHRDGSVNVIRMFLHTRKNADVIYYVDNLLIEKLATK